MAQRNSVIPRYALYGDAAAEAWAEMIGFEQIRERSSLYDFNIEAHRHEGLFQVLYVRQGGGEAFMDGRRWPLNPGSIAIVPANTVHGFQFSPDVDGQVITAAQRPVESLAAITAPALIGTIRQARVMTVASAPRHEDALEPVLEAIRRESQFSASGQLAAGTALLVALFVQLARIGDMQKIYDGGADTRRAAVIEKFRAMVDARFRTGLSIACCAREIGITAGQLSRLCRDTLGMSSRDIVNARIVQEAERELIYSSLSVKQIAATLGFADDAYFGRFFRKQTQFTPTEFRKKARAHLAARQT
ncbi:MAG: helix-turn-helix domain-containing protein [Beijerinckiaceae bacterium]